MEVIRKYERMQINEDKVRDMGGEGIRYEQLIAWVKVEKKQNDE